MKKRVLLYVFLVILFTNLNAQETKNPFCIGGYITTKINHNLSLFGEQYISFLSLGDMGISTSLDLEKDRKILLNVGYSQYYFSKGNEADSSYQLGAITIAPQMYLQGFTVGCEFGFLTKSLLKYKDWNQYNYNKLKYPYIFNIKLGGLIPIYENKLGELNIVINGTISLSYLPQNFSRMQLNSLAFGLNYMRKMGR